MENWEIDILGSKWTVIFKDDDPAFEDCNGYCDDAGRQIIIENIKETDDPLAFDLSSQNLNQKRVIRHEIIHAFLSESGLAESSSACENWASNEEMVDWFARQSPKIFKLFKELKLVQD